MRLPFETDEGIGTRATLGLIVLQTDETIETEFARLMNIDGLALYHSRIPMQPEVTSETLKSMQADLPASAALLPSSADFDVIGYGCTSASTVIGPKGVAEAIQSVHPNAKVADPISSIIAACDAFDAKTIAFVTPYVAEVSARMREMIENSGRKIVAFGSFEEGDDRIVARIKSNDILSAIERVAAQAECDAIVVSCTNLRTAGIVDVAEQRIGKPVISSNLALAWNMLRLAGIRAQETGKGMLFQL
ncbi:aspartate/glutamate racemase family protein [Pseudohalocynthiibacter aestuariivivens]|uniref:Aspartate/glutamate racemase family protein n=1 Tax=Pseudohalocynthiibacter aestuariivivens TaxID=1591409 RepID=A0ABV5J9W8_9RHOB|nr:aspartate/glutamate racemase family protein [Pseudohalocynthiibacter aestuariivivens]MBS9716825.1 aspartate/glutamate racemase family protein [Pseudohalocynthiibacter aestuariivivens]